MIPLSMAKQNEIVKIRKITGKNELIKHLAELGLVVDATIKIISQTNGNMIIQVKDSRIAINSSTANHIMF